MFRQERCHVLAEPVAGVSRQEQFAHARVDESGPGRPLEEAVDLLLRISVFVRIFPRVRGLVLEPLDPEQARPEFPGGQSEVVAPEQLEADGGRPLVFPGAVPGHAPAHVRPGLLEIHQVSMDLPSRHAAQRQPRGQFGAVVQAHHAVAGVFVRVHVTVPDQMPNPFVARGLPPVKRMGRESPAGHLRRVGEAQGGVERSEEAGDDVIEPGRDRERTALQGDPRGKRWQGRRRGEHRARGIPEGLHLFAIGGEDVGQIVSVPKRDVPTVHAVSVLRARGPARWSRTRPRSIFHPSRAGTPCPSPVRPASRPALLVFPRPLPPRSSTPRPRQCSVAAAPPRARG